MIFGGLGARRLLDDAILQQLPGPIVGYGGGTFNMDGSVATPDTRDLSEGQQSAELPATETPPKGMFGRPLPMSSTQATRPIDQARKPTFDYEATQAALMPPRKGSKLVQTLADIAGVLGPALMAASGDGAGASAGIAALNARRQEASRRQWDTNRMLAEWKHQDWARQNAADLDASQPFTLGRSRYQYDPNSGETSMLQHEPADFEDYAAAMGYEPGSPQYVQAAQDYILRGNGPTAVGLDMSLDNHRTNNRATLENLRQQNRLRYQQQGIAGRVQVKSAPTYRDTHPLPQRGGGRSAASAPTATGPNGQKVMWNGSAWVPAT
ncbi:hypothetical protein [Novosphingobium olei]|uniref:Uncharacterized protein n=1 Tax=Novosphingobium olei TaxID=2728851 RepID=A0A7Y0BS52_9SPHN|nr:hypothetical protein [Novosphingobium olei]NML95463.1 hypothetical protein [Novosphingobium olei]